MLFPVISASSVLPSYPDLRDVAPFVTLLVVSIWMTSLAPRGPEGRRAQTPGLVGAGLVLVPAAFLGAAFWQGLDDGFGSCALAGCWPSMPQQALIVGAWWIFAACLIVHGWKLAPRPRYLVLVPAELAGALGLYVAVWIIVFREYL